MWGGKSTFSWKFLSVHASKILPRKTVSYIFKAKYLPTLLKTFRKQDEHFEKKKGENQDFLKTF